MPPVEKNPRGSRRPQEGVLEIRETTEDFYSEIAWNGFDVKNGLYKITENGIVMRAELKEQIKTK